ncbi:Uncharacterized protein FWK35_00014214, partial [Aphis craccivora]
SYAMDNNRKRVSTANTTSAARAKKTWIVMLEAIYNRPNVSNSSENRAFETSAVEIYPDSDIRTIVERAYIKLMKEKDEYSGRGNFETMLTKTDKDKGKSTRIIQKHEAMSYGFMVKASDDLPVELLDEYEIPKKSVIYRRSQSQQDVAGHLAKTVMEIALKIEAMMKTNILINIIAEDFIDTVRFIASSLSSLSKNLVKPGPKNFRETAKVTTCTDGLLQCMPYGGFNWVEPTLNGLNDLDDTSFIGRLYEVDVKYPRHLHNEHNDLPFLPQNSEPRGSKVRKLMATEDYAIENEGDEDGVDPLIYHVDTEDFYADLVANNNLMDRMDTANLPSDHPYYMADRKKSPVSFLMRAKSYAFKVYAGEEDEVKGIEDRVGEEKIKAKGIRAYVVKTHMTLEDHRKFEMIPRMIELN